MTDFTEDDAKLLTEEVLRECFNEGPFPQIGQHPKCGITHHNRNFTSGNDMVALVEAIQRLGKWEEFVGYALTQFSVWGFGNPTYPSFARWLFRPLDEQGKVHFAKLVAEWWKGKEK